MVTAGTVATQVTLDLVAVLLLALVIKDQVRRQVSADAESARNSFVRWWSLLAGWFLALAVFHFSILRTPWGPDGMVAYGVIGFAVIAAAFGSLLDYLIYVTWGHYRLRRYIIGFYMLLFLLAAIALPLSGPFVVEETDAGMEMVLASDGSIPLVGVVAVWATIIPIIAVIGFQVRLFFASRDKKVQYRIAMQVVAVLLFLLAFGLDETLKENLDWILGSGNVVINGGGILLAGLLPVLGAWAGYRAYHPAAWVQKQLGLLVPKDEAAPPLPSLNRK